MSDLRKHLETVAEFIGDMSKLEVKRPGWKYASYEELVLKEGKPFVSPERLRPYGSGIRRGKDKRCYEQAMWCARSYDLHYVEGYATSLIPVAHAWCVVPTGRTIGKVWVPGGTVIDPTWRDSKDQTVEYYGVPMTWHQAENLMFKRGYYGVFACDWMFRNAFLQYGMEALTRKEAWCRNNSEGTTPLSTKKSLKNSVA